MDDRKLCVVCGTIYHSELRTCPEDGAMLVQAIGHQRLRIGHVLGNYRLTRVIGEGGVGTVYEGEHVRLGRKMALKVLHPDIASADSIRRFFNEARAVNQIRHPNIIDVEDFVTAETGEHYLIMELLVGEDLRTVISRDGVLAPDRVTAIGEQIASALAAIHGANILHRDLKPDNIFLTQHDGREVAKILDFGIAKFTADREGMTREGMTLGTPEYMAPEQIVTGGTPGPTSDIYSLGMLLYEALAGAPAFTATTTAAILRGHLRDRVVPPSNRRGQAIPAVLEAAVMKCLAKEPAHRFQRAEDVVAALRAERAVEVIEPRRPASILEPERPRGRGAAMLPALGMAVVALALHVTRPSRAETRRTVTGTGTATGTATATGSVTAPAPVTVTASGSGSGSGSIDVGLISSPAGAEIFIGHHLIGKAPIRASLVVGDTPVQLVAHWSDGSETTQTIVPDRPLPQIAFTHPARHVVPGHVEHPAKHKPVGKDDEIDPFAP